MISAPTPNMAGNSQYHQDKSSKSNQEITRNHSWFLNIVVQGSRVEPCNLGPSIPWILSSIPHAFSTNNSTRKMCGIHAVILSDAGDGISSGLERCLVNRGPDHTGTVQVQLDQPGLFLTFTSTVLSLRGDHIAKQPFTDPASGSVLCWNGEAWGIRGESVQGNDGEAVLALLAEASRSAAHTPGQILDVLRAIEGPFAFIYLDKPAKRLYYGRDRLGRRSLLVKQGQPFALSSIAETPVEGWCEVEADGCYTLELGGAAAGELVPARHDWTPGTSMVSYA